MDSVEIQDRYGHKKYCVNHGIVNLPNWNASACILLKCAACFLILLTLHLADARQTFQIRDEIAYLGSYHTDQSGVREWNIVRYDLAQQQVHGELAFAAADAKEVPYMGPDGVILSNGRGVYRFVNWDGTSRILLDEDSFPEGVVSLESDHFTYSDNWMVGTMNFRTDTSSREEWAFEVYIPTSENWRYPNRFPAGKSYFAANANWDSDYLAGSKIGFSLWKLDETGRVLDNPEIWVTEFTEPVHLEWEHRGSVHFSPDQKHLWTGSGDWFTLPGLEYRGEFGGSDPPIMTDDFVYVLSRIGSFVDIHDHSGRFHQRIELPHNPIPYPDWYELVSWGEEAYVVYFRSQHSRMEMDWEIKIIPLKESIKPDYLMLKKNLSIRDDVSPYLANTFQSVFKMPDDRLLFVFPAPIVAAGGLKFTLLIYDPSVLEVTDLFQLEVDGHVSGRNFESIVFEETGDSLLFVQGEGRIFRLNLNTGIYYPVVSFIGRINGVGVLPTGDIVVASDGRILRYREDGGFIEQRVVPKDTSIEGQYNNVFGPLLRSPDGNVYKIGNGIAYFSLDADGNLQLLDPMIVPKDLFDDAREGRISYRGLYLLGRSTHDTEARYRVVDANGNLQYLLPEFNGDSAANNPLIAECLWTDKWLLIWDSQNKPHLLETNGFTGIPIVNPEIAPAPGQVALLDDGKWIWFKYSIEEHGRSSILPYTIEDLIGETSPVVDILGGRIRLRGQSYTPLMGEYWLTDSPWIYHPQLGWIYAMSAPTNSAYLYIPESGWYLWSDASFPELYSFDRNEWLYYSSWSSNPRWFYSRSLGYWIDDLPGPTPFSLLGRNLVVTYERDQSIERWEFYKSFSREEFVRVHFQDDETQEEIMISGRFNYERIDEFSARLQFTVYYSSFELDITADLYFDTDFSGVLNIHGITYEDGAVLTELEDTGVFTIER